MKYKLFKKMVIVTIGTAFCFTGCSQMHLNEVNSDSLRSNIESSGEDLEGTLEENSISDTEETLPTEDTVQQIETSEVETSEPETEAEPEDKSSVLTHYEDWDKVAVVVGVNSYLNIRMEPSTESVCVGYANLHAGVVISQKVNDDWYEVDINGNKGYISADYLIFGEEAKEAALEYATKRIKVETEVLNVRQRASIFSKVVTQIGKGNLFEVQSVMRNGWYYIQLDSDIKGYVSPDYVSAEYYIDEPVYFSDYIGLSELRKCIIEEALSHYGEDYVWGGTTLGEGVDCSGFTMRVYEKAGITITRNSYTQALEGKKIAFSEMKPGDLIFFDIHDTGGISHVGMYLGNGLMIHAASELRGIVIDQYNYRTPEYARNLIGD